MKEAGCKSLTVVAHRSIRQPTEPFVRPALENLPLLRGCGVVIEKTTSTRFDQSFGALRFSFYNR